MPENTYVRVRVAGPYACFSRPEMKVERVSYEVMTPSAARGILDAILWRPEMRWIIHRIGVLKPIRFTSVRRNEIQSKIPPSAVKQWMKQPEKYEPQTAGAGSMDATPRNTLALQNVAYVIEAEPRVYDPNSENHSAKYMAMFNRRVEKGQCFHRPYLGCREFACFFSYPNQDERPIEVSQDLGLMLYDVVFQKKKMKEKEGVDNQAVFFHARLEQGVMETSPDRVIVDPGQREEVLRCSYMH